MKKLLLTTVITCSVFCSPTESDANKTYTYSINNTSESLLTVELGFDKTDDKAPKDCPIMNIKVKPKTIKKINSTHGCKLFHIAGNLPTKKDEAINTYVWDEEKGFADNKHFKFIRKAKAGSEKFDWEHDDSVPL